MRFRWDWLHPVMRTPYVPTLGPVRPAALSISVFDAIVSVANTGAILPYDKDCRWWAAKDERVIVEEIIHSPGLTIIPTLATRGRGVARIYQYSPGAPEPDKTAALLRTLRVKYEAEVARAVWFQNAPHGARTRLMLKTYTERDGARNCGHVSELESCKVAGTFPAFARQAGEGGFAFLHQRMTAGRNDGPILVAVEDQRIVGAVGPLATLADATGTLTVPPQYYAVHPDYRRRGHGRALWRAAMAWGRDHGAAYKILQAQVGTAAERLYRSEGLQTLGFVCSQDAGRSAGRAGNALASGTNTTGTVAG
jgi:GNAT superfamily N-acetyltransferase